MEEPEDPVFQLYVCAPEAEITILSPPHIVALVGLTETLGAVFTTTRTLSLSVQPFTSVTTTL